MNPQNSRKKSPIHENADANITCDFCDGDINRSRSFLSTTGLTHATNHPQPTNIPQASINNPLNPSGVGLVNFFGESQSRLYPQMRAKFGRGPTVVSKKGSLKFMSVTMLVSLDLTRFNKIATQGAPQMAVDKEANSLSRVYSYYSKFNLRLFYV